MGGRPFFLRSRSLSSCSSSISLDLDRLLPPLSPLLLSLDLEPLLLLDLDRFLPPRLFLPRESLLDRLPLRRRSRLVLRLLDDRVV
jgi:hypothetical protein